MDDELIAELLTRRDEDQRVRHQLSGFVRQPEARLPDDLAAEWERVDEAKHTLARRAPRHPRLARAEFGRR